MTVNKQKKTATINRLSKAFKDCADIGLKLQSVPTAQIQVEDHVLHGGMLKRVVARDPKAPGRAAFEDGLIVDLSDPTYLVLRG
jgi:hypothetical protein